MLRRLAWRAVDRLHDRRFHTALAHDPAGPVLLLSPHPDDAVLNCWSLLTSDDDVRVVNILAGVPPPGVLVAWDRVCGAEESRVQVRERLAEDAAALALAGRTAANLPLLDAQYREGRRPPRRVIDRLIAANVPAASLLYAPLGAVHPDHSLVRRYAASVAAQAGIPLCLYADVPYSTQFGWPYWVTGTEPDPRLDVDEHWAQLLDGVMEIRDHRRARVVRLTKEAAAGKLAAIRSCATQLSGLDAGPLRRITNPAVHPFEVFWDVPAP